MKNKVTQNPLDLKGGLRKGLRQDVTQAWHLRHLNSARGAGVSGLLPLTTG
jgi:hypothetical protein